MWQLPKFNTENEDYTPAIWYPFLGMVIKIFFDWEFSSIGPDKKFSRIQTITYFPIRMSHWRHTMVDGAKFWITCKWLTLLRKAGCLQLIQNLAPSTIVWCQCDIRIGLSKIDWFSRTQIKSNYVNICS